MEPAHHQRIWELHFSLSKQAKYLLVVVAAIPPEEEKPNGVKMLLSLMPTKSGSQGGRLIGSCKRIKNANIKKV